MSRTTRARAGLLATNLFFAANLSAVKYFTGNNLIGAYAINLIRIGVSVFLFWVLFLFNTKKEKIEKKDIPKFIWCALSAIALNQMLFVKGLSYTFSIHASLLLLTSPILITFIAAWILKERINTTKIIGLVLGISGATILITSRKNTGPGNDILWGDILVLMSTVLYTIYFILVKPLMNKYSSLTVMRWTFTFGLIMIIPFCVTEFNAIPWHKFAWKEYWLLFVLVIPGTFLAYIFNVYGIKVLGASVAGAYIYFQPVFAVTIATLFLKEDLELYKIVAGVLIFAGVYLVNRNKK